MKVSTLLSLVGGTLLTVSEIMPYVTKIKSNGIIQFVFDSIFKSSDEEDDKHEKDEKHEEKVYKVKQDCDRITLSFAENDWKSNFINMFRKQKVFKDKNMHIKNVDKKYDTIHIDLNKKLV
jgi:hypothetical protein